MLHRAHYDAYVACLESQRYFDAHEVLEELWFPQRFRKSNEVLLLKGFINAAVSFELTKRGRKTAAKRVWNNYLKYNRFLHTVAKNNPLYHDLAHETEKRSKLIHDFR